MSFLKSGWGIAFLLGIIMSSLVLGFDARKYAEGQHRETDRRLVAAQDVLQRSSHDRFEQQAVMMRVVGEQILSANPELRLARAQQLMDDLLANNPVFLAYALAATNGEILLTSANLRENVGVNLRNSPLTARSFDRAMHNDGVILGDSYHLALLDKVVLPLRLMIRGADGEPAFVLIAGIDLLGPFSPWSTELIGEDSLLTVVKPGSNPGEFFPLYSGETPAADNNEVLERAVPPVYGVPIEPRLIANAERGLAEVAASISDLDTLREPKLFTIKAPDVFPSRSIIGYEPRFRYLIVVSKSLAQMRRAFYRYLGRTGALWALFNGIAFFALQRLFRTDARHKRRLQHQATHDHLTSLPNRYFMDSYFDSWIRDRGSNATLAVVDLDNFKSINDHFGHAAGDQVLVTAGERISTFLQAGELAARYAGDTFVVLLEGTDDDEIAKRSAALRRSLREVIPVGSFHIRLSASIGSARGDANSTAMALLFCAELALQNAKKERDSSVAFTSTMFEATSSEARLQNALRAAPMDEFHVVYQPQVNAANGRVVGCEALLRWNSPELGSVPPAVFIAVAERCGLISILGEFVLNRAIQDMRWLLKSHATLSMSVNSSIHQFMFSDILGVILTSLGASRLPPKCLCIEVTESILSEDSQNVRDTLRRLRQKGIEVSIDDFGTGYSSLSVLRDTEIDEVKIDASFVRSMLDDVRQRSIVQAIIDVSHSVDAIVVAEGVELEEEAAMLREMGCDRLQGYLIAGPMPFAQLCRFLDVVPPGEESNLLRTG